MKNNRWAPQPKDFLEDRIDYMLDNCPNLNLDDKNYLYDLKVHLEHNGYLIQPQEERLDSIYMGWIDRD